MPWEPLDGTNPSIGNLTLMGGCQTNPYERWIARQACLYRKAR